MDDKIKYAFDSAQDIIKQLITLATAIAGGIIALSVTRGGQLGSLRLAGLPIPVAMISLVISIMCGFAALMNIIGTISRDATPDPYKSSVRLFAGIQVVSFLVAVAVLAFVPRWG